ncbi:MAG: Crp/Fnr family transcriptional regulator, partial [Oceanobacter sp.]
KAIFWPLQALTGLLEQHPAAAIAALREVGLILNRATDLIEDLAFRSVESRLARYFLLEARNQQSSQIQLTGTTELIASLLGTSRQTLSSVLNQMEREGLINRPARQQVILKNPTELEKVASVSAS